MTALSGTTAARIHFDGGISAADPRTAAALQGPLRRAHQRLRSRIEGRNTHEPIALRLVTVEEMPSEGFQLSVNRTGVTITARDTRGHRHGLHALARLVQVGAGVVAEQTVTDTPALPVRGLMVDAGRRFWEPTTLHRMIDEMAWRGLNRLQLHLTEWNAFRIALSDPRFADLAAPDSYRADEINALIARAHEDGIEVSVELNLPAHCTALITARPALDVAALDAVLRDGAPWTGSRTDAWMIDVTAPMTRTFCAELLRSLVSEVQADAFHLGADEWFDSARLADSPTLVRRAAELTARHPAGVQHSPADVVVDFLNDMSEVVRSCGAAVELWSWWRYAGARALRPHQPVTITAWGADNDAADLEAAGYRVIASPEDTHYVTPRTAPGNLDGVNYVAADCGRLATEPLHSSVGEQLCIWSDWAEDQPDEYFEWYARRPLQVFADRVWNGPHGDSADVDEIVREADRTSELRFSHVISGTELSLGVDQRLAGVRVNPAHGASPSSSDGKWSAATRTMLDGWRGTVIEIADAYGTWRAVHRLERQLPATWVTLPLDPSLAAAGRVRWKPGGPQPRDEQVEWLVDSSARHQPTAAEPPCTATT